MCGRSRICIRRRSRLRENDNCKCLRKWSSVWADFQMCEENMVKCNKIVNFYPKIVDCTERLSHAKIVECIRRLSHGKIAECIGRLSHEKIVECIGRLSHGKIVDCIGRLSHGKIVECVRGGSNVWEDCGAYGCSV
jgi:hypothetical protein